MKTLLKIAWRNIWRNPRRSWVLIATIAVGIAGYLGTTSFIRGFMFQMVDSTIQLNGGHILIAARGFNENPNLRLFIAKPEPVEKALTTVPGIHYTPEVFFQGMASSSETSTGVIVYGIDPEREPEVTVIAQRIVTGSYLNTDSEHLVVIGEGLANRLHVGVGEKIVLMANSLDNNLASGAFRVAGIYRTASPDFDKAFVYIDLHEAQTFIGYDGYFSDYAVRLAQGIDLDRATAAITAALQDPTLEILTWKDRNPVLLLSLSSFEYFIYLFVVIIFTAIAFSIVNTFLMVIYERIRELGVLMAIGVLPKKIRSMLYLETLFIAALGTILGVLFSLGCVAYFGHRGVDLSSIAQALGKVGISSMLHPELLPRDVLVGFLVVDVIVIIAVLYPAFRASRFKVVDALTHV